jgi:hypothetical protein
MSKQTYNIKITGIGTAEQLLNALRKIAKNIKDFEGTDDELTVLDGAKWEDEILMTELNAEELPIEPEVKLTSTNGKWYFMVSESTKNKLVDMDLIHYDGTQWLYFDESSDLVSDAIKKIK